MDAGEVCAAIRHFRSYWRPADGTPTDRRVIVGLLERARNDIDDSIRRYQKGSRVNLIDVEAQDLSEGDKVYFAKQDQTHIVTNNALITKGRDEVQCIVFGNWELYAEPSETFSVEIGE